ncbi:MAG: cation:proton antiporter [Prevotella sp.]|nr:cation:proton antiporter [Prevotella sp.]
MLDFSQYLPITSPTLIFFVVLFIILIAPIVMGKLRIPHIIGMVLAGIVIGPYGLNILERDSSFELFGRVGLLYIMFLAGIEMDMEGLKKDLGKVTVFGLLTCFVPFILTYLSCVWYLGYPSLASLLLGCIMASNTLVAYPIVVRYGLQRSTVTTLSVGASMLSLLIALVVTAALVGSMSGDTGTLFWVMFFVKFVVWCIAMTWLIRHMTRWFLRRYSDSVMQYIFVLAVMFISAATCELIGLEGILGAFVSGLVLNRFIPNISPLMNRIEFIGNAIFIPYFLIGVGMLINAGLLLEGGNTILVVACIGIFGTLGKAIAAFLTSFFFHRSVHEGNLMFGMTSAHAAGAIALVMVGVNLEIAPGQHLLGDEALNAVVIMILFTCIISTVVTDYASRTIVLREKSQRKMPEDDGKADDEKILIPVKYPETCDTLLNMAMLMRNEKLSRGLIALNVVYDDLDATYNQQEGQRLLQQIEKKAAAADVQVQTQVRLATNIANGIKHAFKEYDASEIILGQHIHDNSTRRFWGQFAQSLFNGLNRQIIIARCTIPLNTIRVFHVAVPSRAEYEPGFYRWLERVSRMVTRLGCRILFHGRDESLSLIRTFLSNRFPSIRADYAIMQHWNDFKSLAAQVEEHQMLVVVTARPGTVSYKSAMERLPDELTTYYKYKNVMIIFPDQYGNHLDLMSFANTQHYEQESIWESIQNMLSRH